MLKRSSLGLVLRHWPVVQIKEARWMMTRGVSEGGGWVGCSGEGQCLGKGSLDDGYSRRSRDQDISDDGRACKEEEQHRGPLAGTVRQREKSFYKGTPGVTRKPQTIRHGRWHVDWLRAWKETRCGMWAQLHPDVMGIDSEEEEGQTGENKTLNTSRRVRVRWSPAINLRVIPWVEILHIHQLSEVLLISNPLIW